MNRKTLEAEVKKRWGKFGQAQSMANGTVFVGRVTMGMFFEVKGQGKTWEEALADADKKAGVHQ